MPKHPRHHTWRDLDGLRSVLALATIALVSACGGDDDPESAEQRADRRADELLAQLTQAEKLQLIRGDGTFNTPLAVGFVPGVARLGIPDLRWLDTTAGVRSTGNGTTPLPSTLALAASWDLSLVDDYATVIGNELRALGVNGALGGGANLAREPRGGRTFEYLGEDPVLAGEMLARRTQATQALGVVATIKHLVGNEQETDRYRSNSIIDERSLRELYALPFEIAVIKGGALNVMCGYNLLNNEKSCENRQLLTHILKDEWGFKGQVQSDWIAALTDTARAANAGTDEEMPGSVDDSRPQFPLPGIPTSVFNQKMVAALAAGTVTQARLDDMVRRKLHMIARTGLLDPPATPAPTAIDPAAGDVVAQKVAERSMVLLKNAIANGDASPVLPLQRTQLRNVVVIGGHADKGVISGGGSGSSPPRDGNAVVCRTPGATFGGFFQSCAIWYKSPPLAAIRALLPAAATVTYFDGTDAAAAAAAAATADVAIVVATQFQSEGADLEDLALPDSIADPANQAYDQNALISAVSARARRTVVVVQSGTAFTMPWLDSVHAVLAAWYPGVRGGPAIANVLFGEVNPSGKLPRSFPRTEADLPQPVVSLTDLTVVYREGLRMGYRWYDATGRTPLFPFGHGLSYTGFAYSDARTTVATDGSVELRFNLRNTGQRNGEEVAQVYADLPKSSGEPPQRLVAWQKVALAAGESKEVAIRIAAARLAIWDNGWYLPTGQVTLRVGGSSRDPSPASATITTERRRPPNAAG